MADGTETAEHPAPPAAGTPLERYATALRRQRIVYFSVVTAIVVVIGVLVSVAWSRGEVANTTLRTVGTAPPALPLAAAASSPRKVWSSGDQVALGQPQWRGTVVVHGAHDVHGIDARTGKRTWSYTRSNRTVCAAAQAGGTTVAIFRLSGNCDQVTALDSGTGKRKWIRTLDIDGQPLDGTAAVDVANQGGFYTVVVRSRSVIYALDPLSGYNRWTYSRYGCAITGFSIGANGALIAQNCSNKVVCGSQQFCKPGPQLVLRNAYDGRNDKDKDNPDKIVWNLAGVRVVPLSADVLVAAADPATGVVAQYDERTGAVTARTTLSPRPSSYSRIVTGHVGELQLVWLDGVAHAFRRGAAQVQWTATTSGPPTVVTADPNAVPDASSARVTVPTANGAGALDPGTGRISQTYPLAAPDRGAQVFAFGDGFLVAQPRGGVTAYAS